MSIYHNYYHFIQSPSNSFLCNITHLISCSPLITSLLSFYMASDITHSSTVSWTHKIGFTIYTLDLFVPEIGFLLLWDTRALKGSSGWVMLRGRVKMAIQISTYRSQTLCNMADIIWMYIYPSRSGSKYHHGMVKWHSITILCIMTCAE